MASRRGAEHASNILEALGEAGRPLTAYDLLDRLRPTGVAAPPTVYRALDKLIASGKVHRIESLNAFVACRHEEHHLDTPVSDSGRTSVAFAICEICGTAEEFVQPDLFEQLERDLAQTGFVARASMVEVRGVCAACRDRHPRRPEPAADD